MKIALAQLNYTIGDFKGNTSKIISSIIQARNEGADLVVFSELAVCGYPPDDLLDYPHFIKNCTEALVEITMATKGITAIVGCPVPNTNKKGRRLYNAACVLSNGEQKEFIFKTLLPTYDVFNEARYFQSNDEFKSVEINGVKTAITICEDLWDEMDFFSYTEDPLKNLSIHQPELVINISASPFNVDKERQRYEILKNQAAHFNLPLIYVNQVGAHNDLIFDGNSLYLNSDGSISACLKSFGEDFKIVDITTSKNDIGFMEENRIEELYKALVFGIKEYFTKMGFSKAVIGSSGGMDSALVQVLATKALGNANVTAVLMPSQFSSEGSVTDAVQLSRNLKNEYHTIPIEPLYNSFETTLKPVFRDMEFNIAEENLQARSRAVLLMAFSNKFGNILLNTSNKSEMSVGYTTLYGDMCGSLSILGDVYKTDVYALARFINREQEIIPVSIIEKSPSAELRHGQKDSDSLPPYEILDAILRLYIEYQQSAEIIISKGFDKVTVERVVKMVNSNDYKRFQAPPILRVSSKAFGRGRQMPLVCRF